MLKNSFFKIISFLFFIVLFNSCDKEFSVVGSDLIVGGNFDIVKDSSSTVQSAWKKTGGIASNNLAVNALGILDNTVFGQTTANFATQVQLESTSVNPVINPDLGQDIVSVTLYIPYFTKPSVSTDKEGRPVYTLDSIYGNKASKIKLKIYENEFLLGNLNTEPGAPLSDINYPQLYYTNQNTFFSEKKGDLLYQNNDFVFSEKEYADSVPATTTSAATTTYTAPGMRLTLDKVFFQKLLFDKTSNGYSLASNSQFEQYFKGLYFSVEKNDVEGVLAVMNFKKGTIVVKYKEKALATDPTLTVEKSITLNLTGNTVNLLNNEPSTEPDSYSSPKADRLYVRGGEGSVATIDLFNPAVDKVTYNSNTQKIELGKSNDIPDELDYIKEKGWLVNDASLTFYVDQTLMKKVTTEPSKMFLYDIKNRKILAAAVLEKDAADRGLKYRFSITDYVRGLIKDDNVNFKLGVSIAQVISNVTFKKIKEAPAYATWTNLKTEEQNAYFFPESSVMSPLGTIFHGSTSTDENKRLKLEIYYTKTN
ncbi:DUF4270 domain-containing protein [Flavobacterium aquicola]|uniref:Uncharacterized protein DUF4270 n=1 Tax=Flavobacterium aquicola TaxID=1682742 RepID=A0A3E0DYP6_9FLAO|nr:DUF4270 domain-containing protein [Flavobacterium aquicola]REG91182.1 uncharacterized protein DUF4270 [Flavobacterium aquicola]